MAACHPDVTVIETITNLNLNLAHQLQFDENLMAQIELAPLKPHITKNRFHAWVQTEMLVDSRSDNKNYKKTHEKNNEEKKST